MLPYDSDHLTEPERATQHQQEKRDCRTCRKAQYSTRSGALMCWVTDAPNIIDVLAGSVICEWYE